jgi:flagellar biogenesis protein FliO
LRYTQGPRAGSIPVLTTKTIKYMKNENLKAIVGLVVAIALVVVMAYILKLTNNI